MQIITGKNIKSYNQIIRRLQTCIQDSNFPMYSAVLNRTAVKPFPKAFHISSYKLISFPFNAGRTVGGTFIVAGAPQLFSFTELILLGSLAAEHLLILTSSVVQLHKIFYH